MKKYRYKRKPRIVFLGATKFGEAILKTMLDHDFIPTVLFSMPRQFIISYSDKKINNYYYADLSLLAVQHDIPYIEVDSVDGKKLSDYKKIIMDSKPDLIVALGWYYMIPPSIRKLAKRGAWGIHASLLPNFAGGAPLVWAIINGEKKTGVTLFQLGDGVDDGDIIAQSSFAIDFKDTIASVYKKATTLSKKMIIHALKNFDSVEMTPQDKTKIKRYPQRTPEDGKIDLSKSAVDIYNFIRAQSSPYPGAFLIAGDHKKIIIQSARLEEDNI